MAQDNTAWYICHNTSEEGFHFLPLLYESLRSEDSISIVVTNNKQVRKALKDKRLKFVNDKKGSYFNMNRSGTWVLMAKDTLCPEEDETFAEIFEEEAVTFPSQMYVYIMHDAYEKLNEMDEDEFQDSWERVLYPMVEKKAKLVFFCGESDDYRGTFLYQKLSEVYSIRDKMDDLYEWIFDPSLSFFSDGSKRGGESPTESQKKKPEGMGLSSTHNHTTDSPSPQKTSRERIFPAVEDANTFANPLGELNRLNQLNQIKIHDFGDKVAHPRGAQIFGWNGMRVTNSSTGECKEFSVEIKYENKRTAKRACAQKAMAWLGFSSENDTSPNTEQSSSSPKVNSSSREVPASETSTVECRLPRPVSKLWNMIDISSKAPRKYQLNLYQFIVDGNKIPLGVVCKSDFLCKLNGKLPKFSPPLFIFKQEIEELTFRKLSSKSYMTPFLKHCNDWYFSYASKVYPNWIPEKPDQVPHIVVPISNRDIDKSAVHDTKYQWEKCSKDTKPQLCRGDIVRYNLEEENRCYMILETNGTISKQFPNTDYADFRDYFDKKHDIQLDNNDRIITVGHLRFHRIQPSKDLPERFLERLRPSHIVLQFIPILAPLFWYIHEHVLLKELFEEVGSYGFQSCEELRPAVTFSERQGQHNYEFMEAIGDTILKFLTSSSVYLCSSSTWSQKSQKEKIRKSAISNCSLRRISREKGLSKYCLCNYTPRPDVQHILRGVRLFEIISEKQEADLVESLIGCVYLNCNLRSSADLLSDWNIFPEYSKIPEGDQLKESINHNIERSPKYDTTNFTDTVHRVFRYKMQAEVASIYYSEQHPDWIGDAVLDFLYCKYFLSAIDESKQTPATFSSLKHVSISNDAFAAVVVLENLSSVVSGAAQVPAAVQTRMLATGRWNDAPKSIGNQFERMIGCIFLDILYHCGDFFVATEELEECVMPVWKRHLDRYKKQHEQKTQSTAREPKSE